VCMGNICRSPTAEGVFRKILEGHAPAHLEMIPPGELPELGAQAICLYASSARPQLVEPLLEALRAEFGVLRSRREIAAA